MGTYDQNDKVSREIISLNLQLDACQDRFARLIEKAGENKEAKEHASALKQTFDDTIVQVVEEIQKAYAKKELSQEDAYQLLSKAKYIAHAVANQRPMDQNFLTSIVKDMRSMDTRQEVGEIREKTESCKAKKHAIHGLLATAAIVATVAIALTLAAPSMGASLFLLLPFALTGAGCAIPSALKLRHIGLEVKQDLVSEKNTAVYAKRLQETYKSLLSKDSTPKGGDELEHESDPTHKP